MQQTGFLLRDDAPEAGINVRPTTWHVAALLASGFRVHVHETKHDATGRCWRTWKSTEWPVLASPDPDIARGAAHCVATLDSGRLAAERPFSPYLAAYLGAKNLDMLDDWRLKGGVEWFSKAVAGGISPLAEVVPAVGNVDLAEMVLGVSVRARVPHALLAAALATLGFPLAGLTAAGIPQFFGVVTEGKSSGDQAAAESLLCPGLSFGVAAAAAMGLDEMVARQQRNGSVADGTAVEQVGALPGGHLFNWAYLGALRRQNMRMLEQHMGHDGAKLRSHVLQPKRGKRVADGLAVVCTAEEFSANEAYILAHLRGR
jgi:hypothetical protein